MWEMSKWQYFTATIVSFDSDNLKYTINWDDQDPSGRIVDYYNLALDRVPEPDEVAIESIVLFPQGKYKGQEGVRLGGQRYHQVSYTLNSGTVISVISLYFVVNNIIRVGEQIIRKSQSNDNN